MNRRSTIVLGCAVLIGMTWAALARSAGGAGDPVAPPRPATPSTAPARSSSAPPRSSTARPRPTSTPATHRFGLEKPLPRQSGAVRIAAYNMLNFFDHADDPNLQGEWDDLPNATPDERCRNLAAAIRAIDADIISLEEVESLEALTWFRDNFLPDAGYKYLASKDAGYYRGVEQSIMSRFPITDSKVWLNEPLENVKRDGTGWTAVPASETHYCFQRSPLMVNVKVNEGYELTIFAIHHKAGREFNWQREAEALRIVDFIKDIEQRDPKRNILAMGDFNAAPWDKSVRVYLRAGMVDTLDYRLIDKDSPESPQYKTHESDKVFDYILMNSAAYREYVPGSGFVFGTVSPPSNYDYQKDPQPPGYASDHYPVVIDILPHDQP
jgi:endonuclease/exonuclease/phosphatase family metal-dependent hydrolase